MLAPKQGYSCTAPKPSLICNNTLGGDTSLDGPVAPGGWIRSHQDDSAQLSAQLPWEPCDSTLKQYKYRDTKSPIFILRA